MQPLSSTDGHRSGPGSTESPASPSVGHRSWHATAWRLGRVVFLAAVLAFVGHLLWRNWGELREHEFSLRWQPIAVSYAVLAVYLVNRGLIWHWMTYRFGCAIPLRQTLAAWFYSLPGKYVPGKLFLFAGRLHFYRRQGQSSLRVSMCFGLEAVSDILGGILVLLIAPLFADLPILAQYRIPALVLAALFLIAVRPAHLELLANAVLKLAGRPPVSLPAQYRDMLGIVGMFTLNWALLGLGFFLFASALHPVQVQYLVYVAGAFALSCTIGILALFAPGGLGVREGILVISLSAIMPQAIAVAIALASRIWMTMGEMAAVGVVAILTRIRPGKTSQPTSSSEPYPGHH